MQIKDVIWQMGKYVGHFNVMMIMIGSNVV